MSSRSNNMLPPRTHLDDRVSLATVSIPKVSLIVGQRQSSGLINSLCQSFPPLLGHGVPAFGQPVPRREVLRSSDGTHGIVTSAVSLVVL